MLEKRNDVLCRLAVAEAITLGMAAQLPPPIRSAFTHGIGRVERRQFERLPKGVPPTGFGPRVTERARRMLPGMTAGIVAKRSRCLRARAATDSNITLPPWTGPGAPVAVAAVAVPMRTPGPEPHGDRGPDARRSAGGRAWRMGASAKAVSWRRGIPGRSKRRREQSANRRSSNRREKAWKTNLLCRFPGGAGPPPAASDCSR